MLSKKVTQDLNLSLEYFELRPQRTQNNILKHISKIMIFHNMLLNDALVQNSVISQVVSTEDSLDFNNFSGALYKVSKKGK